MPDMSFIRIRLVLALCLSNAVFLIFEINAEAPYHGIMAYIEKGTPMATMDLLEDISQSEKSDLYRHRLSLRDMIATGDSFRSPLIDRWSELNVTELFIVLFNSDGIEVKGYNFDFRNAPKLQFTPDNLEEFFDGYSVLAAEFNLSYGPSIIFHDLTHPEYLSAMILNRYGDGETFIYDTEYSTPSPAFLPEAEYQGCYEVTPSASLLVTRVSECAYYCMTKNHTHYFSIVSQKTSTSIVILPSVTPTMSQYCQCLSSKPTVTATAAMCTVECTDGRSCGSTVGSSFASVYSKDILQSFVSSLSTWNVDSLSEYKVSESSPQVDLGNNMVYISKVFITNPTIQESQTFQLGMSQYPCNDPNLYFELHRDINGNITIFTSEVTKVVTPFPAKCLNVSFLQSGDTPFSIHLDRVTSNFLEAQYLLVYAHWNNAACTSCAAMSHGSIIPDSAITIQQTTQHSIDGIVSTSGFLVPDVSRGRVLVKLPNSFEFLVKSIVIESNVSINAYLTVRTNRKCLNQHHVLKVKLNSSSASSLQMFSAAEVNGSYEFCAEELEITVEAERHVGQMFSFITRVLGCALNTGSQTSVNCNDKNLLDEFEIKTGTTLLGMWYPRKRIARDALRPGGVGLLVDITRAPWLEIRLASIEVDVNSIELFGDIIGADITMNGLTVYLAINSLGRMYRTFSNTKASTVRIQLLHATVVANAGSLQYARLAVQIEACVVVEDATSCATGNTTLTTAVSETTTVSAVSETTTVSGLSISMPTINNTTNTTSTTFPSSSDATPIILTNNSVDLSTTPGTASLSTNSSTTHYHALPGHDSVTTTGTTISTSPASTTTSTVPMTTSNSTVPMTTSNSTVPMTTPNSTAPMTTSNSTVPMTTSNSTAPMTTSNSTVPMTTSNSTVPMTTSNSTAPMTTSNSTVPMTTSNSTVPMTTSNSTVPMTTSNSTVPMTTSNSTVPMTTPNSTAPMTTSNSTVPMTTSNSTVPMTTSNSTVPMTTSNSTVPMTTSNSTVPMTTSNSTVPMTTSNSTAPMTTSNSTVPMTTSNSTVPMTTSNSTVSMTTSNSTVPMTTPNSTTPMTTSNSPTPMTTSTAPVSTTASTAPVATTTTTSPPTATSSTVQTLTTASTPGTTTILTTPEATVSTTTSPNKSAASTQPPLARNTTASVTNTTDALCCSHVCHSNKNLTETELEELEEITQSIVKNLTVPKTSTSAFKRTKISAPDNRTSTKVIGGVAIGYLSALGVLIIMIDITFIIHVVKSIIMFGKVAFGLACANGIGANCLSNV